MEEYTETKITESQNYEMKLTEDFIKSLPKPDRKVLRSELYHYPEEGLKYELFDQMRNFNILEFDPNSNINGSKHYKGTFRWDVEEIDNLPIKNEINIKQLKQVLLASDDITYEKAEAIFNGDPNFLLATMSLITSNYTRLLTEIESRYMHNKDVKDIYFFRTDFLFTDAEEIIFLTGRTLLQELADNSQGECAEEYINEIIDDLDSVACKFNSGLIGKFARRRSYLVDNEDLVQEGKKAILHTLKKFDIDKGVKFSTYSTWWIRRYVDRYFLYNSSSIKRPIYLMNALYRFGRVGNNLRKENAEEPTFEETWDYCIKNKVKLPKNKENFKKAYLQNKITSLDDESVGSSNFDGDTPFYNYVEDKSNSMKEEKKDIENKEYVNMLIDLANLNDREESIVKMRTGLIPHHEDPSAVKYTLKEIGEIYGITRERVRQINNIAMRKLRKAVVILEHNHTQ
jgi:RNA polymerase sigma factor (sigma-70 family)